MKDNFNEVPTLIDNNIIVLESSIVNGGIHHSKCWSTHFNTIMFELVLWNAPLFLNTEEAGPFYQHETGSYGQLLMPNFKPIICHQFLCNRTDKW